MTGETKESQKTKKEDLITMFHLDANKWEISKIQLLMKVTYASQHKYIISRPGNESILKDWPFLFQECGMIVHFRELTDVCF